MQKQVNPLLLQVIDDFSNQYQEANLHIRYSYGNHIVCAYGQDQFCVDGYNLLYNLKRLTDVLADELR